MSVLYMMAEITANFIESLIGYKLICFVLNKNYKSRLIYMLAALQAVFLFIIQYEDLFSNYVVFVVTLFVAIAVSWIYEEKFYIALTVSAMYFINIVALTELSSLVILGLFSKQEYIGRILVGDQSMLRSAYVLFIKCVQVIIYFVLKKYIRDREKSYKMILEQWKIILMLNAISYICLFLLLHYVVIEITSSIVVNWLSYIVFFLLSTIIFIFYLRIRNDSEKRELVEIKNKVLEQSYDNLKQVFDRQAKSAHDLNNHLNILYKYAGEQDSKSAMEYIDDIRQPFLINEMECCTGNDMIDFILNSKISETKKYKIKVNLDTKICKLGISDRDINSLLSNILDNAIEASKEGEENVRIIDLWMKTINDTFIIKARNNYVGQIRKKGKNFITNKSDKRVHGIGLQIVKDIVKKYDGSISFKYDDKIFQVLIELPMKTDNRSG